MPLSRVFMPVSRRVLAVRMPLLAGLVLAAAPMRSHAQVPRAHTNAVTTSGPPSRDEVARRPLHLDWRRDATSRLTIADVRRDTEASLFSNWQRGGDLNLGHERFAVWVRVTIPASPPDQGWLLTIRTPLDSVALYLEQGDSVDTISAQPVAVSRTVKRAFALPRSATPQRVYLRARSRVALAIPIVLHTERTLQRAEDRQLLFDALYYGAVFAALLLNVILSGVLRDRRPLLFAAAIGAVGLGIFIDSGRLALWWGDAYASPQGYGRATYLLAGALQLSLAARSLGGLARLSRLIRALRVLSATLVLIAAAIPLVAARYLEAGTLASITLPVLGAALLCTSLAAFHATRLGIPGARWFLVGFSILWISAIITGLRLFALIPSNELTLNTMLLGSMVQIVCFGLALAAIIRHDRRLRDDAVQQVRQAEQRLVNELRASEQSLTRLVLERTQSLELAVAEERRVVDQYVRFGALISHEFRNPLAIILAQLTMLRGTTDDRRVESVVRIAAIQSAARRLSALFDTWLAGNRIREVIQRFEPVSVDLRTWLPACIVRLAHDSSTHPVSVEIDEGVPHVTADPHLLEVAVSNLLVNVSRYTPAGTHARFLVCTTSDDAGAGVTITLEDNGPGIPDEMQTTLFDPYVRGPGAVGSGLGLGLSFVRRIAEVHGGRVALDSRLGEGCRFHLWFPEESIMPIASIAEATHG
ncbi:MAG: sensor histidine kinase [Gemmatimonadota bacterium]|nr:sensor histidine kinase [Gemmatimonadota bacterium]